jgi:hypothetical protein
MNCVIFVIFIIGFLHWKASPHIFNVSNPRPALYAEEARNPGNNFIVWG